MKQTFYIKLLCSMIAICWMGNLLEAQAVIDPFLHPKFVNPLPTNLPVSKASYKGVHQIVAKQFVANLGLVDPATNQPLSTTMYGYNGIYPGPIIEATADQLTKVTWKNKLNGPHILPIDTTIHWANPETGIPIVTHLHGGHTEPDSDGYPDAWYTRNWGETGSHWVKKNYRYANTQEPTMLWYHDHTTGITRLNNYAGLNGMYFIRDAWEASLNLPSGDYEIPLMIQDKTFLENGELFFPYQKGEIYQPEPSIQPEFFGDFNLVNGKVWPVLEVEQRKYRFRVLNAADSRFYNLKLEINGNPVDLQTMMQIGSDGGFIDHPVIKTVLLMAPSERMDIIIDFSTLNVGDEIIMTNDGAQPFPLGSPPDPSTQGVVMKFVVKAINGFDLSEIPTNLRQSPLPNPTTSGLPIRKLLLAGTFDETGRLKPLLGTQRHGILRYTDPITENPQINQPEVWEILNVTPDDHPIHLHQIQFQGVEVVPFDVDLFDLTGVVVEIGPPVLAPRDWKDTFVVPVGSLARIRVEFDMIGLYVWHCHILSHEDFDMMRPLYIGDCNNPQTPVPMEFMDCNETNATASISGKIWEDTNGNGIQDGGEPGIINASVELITASALVFRQVVFTDADGGYSFSDIEQGSYHVVFGNPGGYFSTLYNQGTDDTKNCDMWYSGQTDIIVFNAGEHKTNVDGGFVPEMGLPPVLDPIPHPKFVNALPIPEVARPSNTDPDRYDIDIVKFTHDMGIVDPDGNAISTTMYGYNGMFPGPTIKVTANQQTQVKWSNQLPTGADGAHILPLDQTIHWANPLDYPASGVPVVAHLHGGHTEPAFDGYPDAWYTPGNSPNVGDFYSGDLYTYANTQEPTTLWYHDHTIGTTRLNMNAGLAGFYMINDPWEQGLGLPSGNYEIPLMLTDRSFREDGELYFPSYPGEQWMPNPSLIEEFFGDFNIVNGKVWPMLEVEPRKYRFRVLNAADARFYNIMLSNGMPMTQIGSDGGFLDIPISKNNILLGPAERADIIIDFSGLAVGTEIIMTNDATAPFPFGTTPDPGTAGQIMMFKVKPPSSGPDNSVIPNTLRPAPIVPIDISNAATRQLMLLMGMDQFGRLKPLLGTAEYGLMPWRAPISENPQVNVPEVWEIINLSPDEHPIHLHQVFFQALEIQRFDDNHYDLRKELVYLDPPIQLPLEWKDTYTVPPSYVLRLAVNFDIEGLYVWHCHILSHEDFDMMRPMYVGDCEAPVAVAPIDFMECGPVQPSSINGKVWEDTNGDGILDGGEFGIENDLVEAFDYLGNFKGSAITDANGDYSIPVAPGMYNMGIGSPGAYRASPYKIGNDPTVDSDMLFSLGVLPFWIKSGQHRSIDAGFTLVEPTCDLNASFSTICNDNGTPADSNDDTWSIELTVSGSGHLGWSSQNSSFSGDFNSTQIFGDYPYSGSSVILVLIDNSNPFCITQIEIPTPNYNEECEGTPPAGCNVSFTTNSSSISVSGLTAPHVKVRVFDSSWDVVYECFDDCDNPEVITGLPDGSYRLDVLLMDASWSSICNVKEDFTITGGSGSTSQSNISEQQIAEKMTLVAQPESTFLLFPNPVENRLYVQSENHIGDEVDLEIYNQIGQIITTKHFDRLPAYPIPFDLSKENNGLYWMVMKTETANLKSGKFVLNR